MHRVFRLAAVLGPGLLVLLVLPSAALGHTLQKAGSYSLEIGWDVEPTYVGIPNGVQVTVTDAAGKPVNDLATDDLRVVVSTNGQSSQALSFDPAFDLAEGTGPFGQYDAAIVPTAPGDYSFHLTGSIHGQSVDVTVTSGDTTFDSVSESTDLQFPAKLPSLSELSTKVDRIDARVTALQSPTASGEPAADAVQSAQAAAAAAQGAATTALVVGIVVGGVGIAVGLVALVVARRASRRSA